MIPAISPIFYITKSGKAHIKFLDCLELETEN